MTPRKRPGNQYSDDGLSFPDLNAVTLPATRPALVDSEVMRLKWKRDLQDADIELSLIAEQLSSAERIRNAVAAEALTVRDAEVAAADARINGKRADADRVCKATTEALNRRRDDVLMMRAGIEQAIEATKGDA